MSKVLRQVGIYLAIVVIALPAVFFLSESTSARRTTLAESYEDSDLELQGSRLKGFALGTEGLLADWYWISSLQYLGNKVVKSELANVNIEDLRPLNPRLLYPLLDNATDLDPKFIAAYTYGAVVLPAIDPALAIKLTEKGIANNPDSWRLYQYLGYIYWRVGEYEKAAKVYETGSKISDAPSFMKQMSAAMLTKGGSRETAREIYTQMWNQSDDTQSRQNAELRLMQLDALDEIEAVNSVLKTITANGSPCPNSVGAIFPSLRNAKLPNGREFRVNTERQLVDPSGVAYRFDPSACTVGIDNANSKIPNY